MKSKILFTIFIFLTAVVVFLAYRLVQERYYSAEDPPDEPTSLFEEIKNGSAGETKADLPEPEIEQENTAAVAEEETKKDIERDQAGNARINVLDCSDNCERLQENKEDFKYCKKLCGFTPVTKKENRSECADLSGSDLDFCLRDLAVTKKDFKICSEISDKRIKDACNNRIIEDIFEEK